MPIRAAGLGCSAVLHVALLVFLNTTVRQVPVTQATAADPQVVMVSSGDLGPTAMPDDLGIHVDSTSIPLPGFAFDAGKVISRAGALFPFLTRRPVLDHVVERARTRRRGLSWISGEEDAPETMVAPTLTLGAAALQRLIDASWSRRERWAAFRRVQSLAERYDADAGSVPPLLRQYEIQNGLQPYVDGAVRDQRLWVELGLAADHADFIDFIARYAASHPSTKARVELLFLLDKIAQASVDALATLLDIVPEEDLQWTRHANPSAYEALVDVQRYYVVQLEKHRLGARRALGEYYDGMRLGILSDILETTPAGYRANDARFLIGAILWRQGRATDAIATWMQLQAPAESDEYAAESQQLLGLLRASTPPQLDTLVVNQILKAQRGRWLSFSATRLRQFGYHFDTY